jgi:hypothetical protein
VSQACRVVELGHQFGVGGAGGNEVLITFFELQAHAGGLLLELVDLLGERVNVGGRAESAVVPGQLVEGFGEPVFELPDARGQPERAFAGGKQSACSEARVTPGPPAGAGWGGLEGVDLAEKIWVPVEEAAVDIGGAGRCRRR